MLLDFQIDIDNTQNMVEQEWNIATELELVGDLQENVDILTLLLGEDKLRVGYILPHIRSAGLYTKI